MDHLLSGNVAERPLPKVLYLLVAREFTGALRFEQEGRRYALWWRGGAVVDAESAAPEDSLGRVLQAAGLIDASQLSESLRRMAQNPGRSQLEMLVEAKALEGEAVAMAARTGLARRALRPFYLAAAGYHAEEQAHERNEGGPLDGRWLIYRGLRAGYDAERLGRELAPLEPYAVRLLPEAEAGLGAFGFGDEERFVLAYLVKGYWCLPDLVDACASLPPALVHAIVYALLVCEQLDVKPAQSVPRLRKRAREQTQAVGAVPAPRPGAPTSIPPPAAPAVPPAIVGGGGGAGATARPKTPVPAATPRPGTPVPQARAGTPVPQARAGTPVPAMTEAQLRAAVKAKFDKVEAGANLFDVLEITPNASGAEVKAAYFRLAKSFHPDRVAAQKIEDLRPQVERIFARMSEAFSVLGDDAKRAEYKKVQAAGGEEAVRRREEEEQAKALAILGAEEHFRLGEMALRRNQFALALDEFRQALEGNPEESEHHALFAWATFAAASDKQAVLAQVKQGFARALELNDKCVPAYFYLGHVYNYQQDFPRALAQFRRAIELRPGYVEAEREARLIEGRAARGQLGKSSATLNPFRKK